MAKKDYYLVTVIGFLVGILIIFPAINIGFKFNLLRVLGSIAGFSILAPIAFFLLRKLSRFRPTLYQVGKFLATGSLNTLMDFGILNILILLTDISRGTYYVVFKVVSFVIAGTNSYLWTKYWVFGSSSRANVSEYSLFFTVTTVGAIINIAIAAFVVNFIGAPPGFPLKLWSNVGAFAAVIFSMFWNFSFYKFLVFKPKRDANITSALS